MAKQPKIDPEAWWRDPLGQAIKDFFEYRNAERPGERFSVGDEETLALMKLELLLQAKLIRTLDRERYEISPLVRALAEVIGAAEATSRSGSSSCETPKNEMPSPMVIDATTRCV